MRMQNILQKVQRSFPGGSDYINGLSTYSLDLYHYFGRCNQRRACNHCILLCSYLFVVLTFVIAGPRVCKLDRVEAGKS